jgi:hypothetical protein
MTNKLVICDSKSFRFSTGPTYPNYFLFGSISFYIYLWQSTYKAKNNLINKLGHKFRESFCTMVSREVSFSCLCIPISYPIKVAMSRIITSIKSILYMREGSACLWKRLECL